MQIRLLFAETFTGSPKAFWNIWIGGHEDYRTFQMLGDNLEEAVMLDQKVGKSVFCSMHCLLPQMSKLYWLCPKEEMNKANFIFTCEGAVASLDLYSGTIETGDLLTDGEWRESLARALAQGAAIGDARLGAGARVSTISEASHPALQVRGWRRPGFASSSRRRVGPAPAPRVAPRRPAHLLLLASPGAAHSPPARSLTRRAVPQSPAVASPGMAQGLAALWQQQGTARSTSRSAPKVRAPLATCTGASVAAAAVAAARSSPPRLLCRGQGQAPGRAPRTEQCGRPRGACVSPGCGAEHAAAGPRASAEAAPRPSAPRRARCSVLAELAGSRTAGPGGGAAAMCASRTALPGLDRRSTRARCPPHPAGG
ncbi:hypothetical protein ACRRTK_002594 [Alexandromys fortis]